MPFHLKAFRTVCLAMEIWLFTIFFQSCDQPVASRKQQTPDTVLTRIGGPCDGCALMYEGMPEQMDDVDTSAAWSEPGTKLLITGTVYHPDGHTPATGIIIYYYHTDHSGHYSRRTDRPGAQTGHGYIRGWLKTGARGTYAIYSSRPAPYPHDNIEAHIHMLVKEPTMNEYYVDGLVFDDDPFLTAEKCVRMENRGGSGILKVQSSADMQVAPHDIVLGLHIPDYPEN
jgi:protocatechuate 3,4-dioxygenase beta subunit